VRAYTTNSKKLVGVSAAAIALVLWLSVSFWGEAYVQRKDAVQLQKSILAEDALITLARLIATERTLVYSLYSSDKIESEQLAQWRAHVELIDHHTEKTINKIALLRDDQSLESRFRYNKASLQKKLERFDNIRVRLDVYRSYLDEQMSRPLNERDNSMHAYIFDVYSNLILSANELRLRTFFLSRKNNKDVMYSEDLKNSIWVLNESSRQIFSLLNSYIKSSETANYTQSINEKLRSTVSRQHQRVEQALGEIVEFSQSSNLDNELIARSSEVNQWYRGQYRNVKIRLINAIDSGKTTDISSLQWQQMSDELSERTNTLGNLTASKTLIRARAVERKAVNNLLIDTLLVVLCIAMGSALLVYLRRVHHQANHDDLTGLPNRRHFNEVLSNSIVRTDQKSEQVILMSIDLNGFKAINDTMGHAIGDKLLVLVAERLDQLSGAKKSIARMGGDEFSVHFVTKDANEAMLFAEKIQEELARPFSIDDGVVHVSASIGYCVYPDDANNVEKLQISSDLAMFCAKKEGRSCIRKFNENMSAEFEHRLHTEKDLLEAIDKKQFQLQYQPQFNLSLNSVDAVESLIRWNHPKRGLVSPAEFIPVAEDSGLMPPIGEWVLNEAIQQNAYWVNELNISIRVAVNVSVQQIMQPNFVDLVIDTLSRHKLDPRHLELEVTESVVTANVEWVVQSLLSLRQHGIKIALDDFGTGYSSLSQLQELPVSTLKIDRSFISRLEDRSSTSNSVAETIAALARAFNLDTVAEGVESEHQLNLISELGIDVVQGYYYSKPVSSEDVPTTLAEVNSRASNRKKAA